MVIASLLAYAAAAAAIVLAILFVAEMTSTRGHRAVSGAMLFGFLAVPVLLAVGAALIWAGVAVGDGAPWARWVLEIGAWIALAASVGLIVRRASRGSVHRREVIRGALVFALVGAPAIAMICLLRCAG